MAKLVILNQGMIGRAYDLVAERTTVGRVEDNSFQIADPSVSSHHAEIHLRGPEILIRDLNSTNGSYINDARITESILKPGQTLRLGQVEMKLETEGNPVVLPAGAPAAASAPSAAAAPAAPAAPPPKKQMDATMVIPRGVSLDQLEQGGKGPGFDTTSTVFKKKKNNSGKLFWIIAGVGILVIIVLIVVVASSAKSH
ncbi:MAG TPA: FHA domain-containing protein [Desulfuromonadaceae bacterium]|nr:FHA domain-containing protein [Desulfuromonadaceae bacterium]